MPRGYRTSVEETSQEGPQENSLVRPPPLSLLLGLTLPLLSLLILRLIHLMMMLLLLKVQYLGSSRLGRRRLCIFTRTNPHDPLSSSTSMRRAPNDPVGPCTPGSGLPTSSKSVRPLRHIYTKFLKAKNQ